MRDAMGEAGQRRCEATQQESWASTGLFSHRFDYGIDGFG